MFREKILSSPTWKEFERNGMNDFHEINLPALLYRIQDAEHCPEIELAPFEINGEYFAKKPSIRINKKIFRHGSQLFSLPIIFTDHGGRNKLDVGIFIYRRGEDVLVIHVYSDDGKKWVPSFSGLILGEKRLEYVDFLPLLQHIPNVEQAAKFSRIINNIIMAVLARETEQFAGTMDDWGGMAGHC